MKTVQDIRSEFLGFFEKQGHEIVSSSSLVPHNDPTLMFTNAGMVQFKDVFTGKEKRDYSRATTAQKCVRAGGKHNDLENVGYTARHHTFFEMLGNFSFGDYFKDEAIAFAWEMVTKNFGLPKEKLLVTVHSSDDEAAAIWKKVAGFGDDKIIRIATDDNFWRMGDTGPCGPCTEIFYDHGEHIWGGPPGSPEEDGDRFIEIWNIVFMQYEQIDANTRVDLPNQSIDTGMGLERIAATLMGSNSNYDIDIFQALMDHSTDLTGFDRESPSHKVVADHLRAASFLMSDGVMPSNEGRGYVLRRIMRRGMRHAHIMGAKDPLMFKLFPTLLDKMGQAYPELKRAGAMITSTLENEEKRFKETLDKGLKLLDEEVAKLGASKTFPGESAFKLYDTYGFPLDLTQDALKSKDIEVDQAGFDAAMAEQKKAARAAWSGSGEAATEEVWFDLLEEFGPTEFLGYESEQAEAQVLAIIKDGKRVDALKVGESGFVLTNQTPFYAESGGQVGDCGTINGLEVIDTKKMAGKLHLHHIEKGANEEISVGDAVELKVDSARRAAIKSNHSATHLLHEALRQILGDHVAQKGSLQDENRTRFDISHPTAITAEELNAVEEQVNAEIKADSAVITRVMPLEDARESGAMALFGEKYEDEVRVVSMGTTPSGAPKPYSVELCGGTHVSRTGEIGKLKIISEGALSSGVRRVEAVTGSRVDAYEAEQARALQEKLDKLKTDNDALREELSNLGEDAETLPVNADADAIIKSNKLLQKLISDTRLSQATQGAGADDAEDIGGVKFIGKILGDFPAKDLKPMADELKKKIGSGVVVLIAGTDKASIVVGVTDDLTGKISAVDLVRAGSEALGGKGGGGRPDMAQAGGSDVSKASEAVAALKKMVG